MSPHAITRVVTMILLLFALTLVPNAAAEPGPKEWLPHCAPGDMECGWRPPTTDDIYGWARATLEDLTQRLPDCVPGDLECGWPYS